MTTTHATEVARGDRFEFGANWTAFLSTVDLRRIDEAERSVRDLLERTTLAGLRFLDIGCGSGLFSLAARRLGATVHSIDYDPKSVSCTRSLRQRDHQDDSRWTVQEGSVLDVSFMDRLGQFDVVYSWGVLHHTGSMWRAIDVAADRVAPNGLFALALYNDEGARSDVWRRVKRVYCSGPGGRLLVSSVFMPYFAVRAVIAGLRRGHPLAHFTNYKSARGMSVYHDWRDWLGGYPYEVATPAAVEAALGAKGFERVTLRFEGGHGCNEFVYRRTR